MYKLYVTTKGNSLTLWHDGPGGAHDSRILRSSHVWDLMENGEIDGFILGDSGYPCRSWLMTPLLNPQTAPERHYNSAHTRIRVLVEQNYWQMETKVSSVTTWKVG